MSDRRSQGGYILPITLLVLSCTLLWGSALLLTLSDQYAASNDIVKQEQSRLLAYSGWNLAIQQLDEAGTIADLQIQKDAGYAEVAFEQEEPNLIHIHSSANAGGYLKEVQGTIRLLKLPWDEITDWVLTEDWKSISEPSVYCSTDTNIVLDQSIQQPLAISSLDNVPVSVAVPTELQCTILYVQGDLEVEAPLQAEAVYVSGQIRGGEQINSNVIVQQYCTEPDYRVLVAERIV